MDTEQPKRPRRRKDPTPEEIRQRCLEVQATWTDEIRQSRQVQKPVSPTIDTITPDRYFEVICLAGVSAQKLIHLDHRVVPPVMTTPTQLSLTRNARAVAVRPSV